MKTLRVTGVPEHFNFPWKNVIQNQPFLDKDIELEWIDESRGSGQMNLALRNGDTEIALILTESFLKDFEAGNPSKMIGYHVISPLIWGIHVGINSKLNALSDISRPLFYISRPGSGSQLMGLALAEREKWNPETLQFEVVSNLPGALVAYQNNPDGLFLWEKFTTKPWVDSKKMKRIGEIPSPWPCFSIIASDQALKEFGEEIFQLRDLVYEESYRLEKSKSDTIRAISIAYELQEKDVKAWISQTKWATTETVSLGELKKSMDKMVTLGIIQQPIQPRDFLRIHRIK
ncbi:ABC transporter substrate-binding protein [Algoriphagus sp. PAP.12]|uniref:ABC transporter substrate-binding protein n=1 Tax=Algoriphagus sp. PAP.12 TaxID=2996678 RepID=UPI00227BCDFA|nr:ABC transporter substrate-binding protein [Algoriphagus sp. PAP.12]